MMKRIFTAIKIIPEKSFLDIHSSFQAILANEKIKWVDTSNIHLTLAFLGDIDEKRIPELAVMLKLKCAGSGEFDFTLAGAGIFKNLRDSRVIWLGVKEYEKLISLYEEIKAGLKETGFQTEDRQFRPHITIGRIKFIRDAGNLGKALEMYRDQFIQKVNVEELVLYESILKPSGPVYKALEKFRLV
ncbi:MAG TPA: RNA 2',3'-cyclic phosphodiesterase [Bacteroidales bacterium]|jgi:2'-5' RNA ligase|nr:RNA 2',3'-cyclic phosphodiesterase [Bacteroidales bacterium]HOS71310.1 RNA 2',3'-cyclic phosphodiesterase [Bacteroidales bacterium]